MTPEPRSYDREFTTPLHWNVRRRIGYSHHRGEVTRFVIQLEYYHEDDWLEIVRFDHHPSSENGHNVTVEGVHTDVYREGEKLRSEEIFPPMPADQALTYAEEHLATHAKRYIKRFEQWHGIKRR